MADMSLSRALWCGGQSACLAPCRPGFESGWGDHALPSLHIHMKGGGDYLTHCLSLALSLCLCLILSLLLCLFLSLSLTLSLSLPLSLSLSLMSLSLSLSL